MSKAVVLATGESMNQALADSVRGRCIVIAVSDAYKLAPWADALVANDRAWWVAHPDAKQFAGRKFCGTRLHGTEQLPVSRMCPPGSNSGLRGMQVAWDKFAAALIGLCGFDMRGTHYFGRHPAPLKNTTPARFQTQINQFRRWNACPVINLTPGSALTRFPAGDLDEFLRS